jgi:hypothetical protein
VNRRGSKTRVMEAASEAPVERTRTVKVKLSVLAGGLVLLTGVVSLLIACMIYPGLGLEQAQKQEYRKALDEAARLWADTAGAELDRVESVTYSDDYPMPRVLALCRFKKSDEPKLVFFDLRYSGHWWRFSVTNFTELQNFSEPAITFGNFRTAVDLIRGYLRNLLFNLKFMIRYCFQHQGRG